MSGPDHELDDLLARGGLQVDWVGPEGEPVTTITLARPEVRNAQTPSTWRALSAVGENLPATTRVVVLRALGPSFSAGLDLRMFGAGVPGEAGLAEIATMDTASADAAIADFQRAFSWWRDADVVSVAAVQGAAVGAGFQLALACDLVVCAPDARFAMREPTLGLVPDLGGTGPLVRAVGYGRALEICATGRWVDAAEAYALGLAVAVADEDGLGTAVDRLVGSLLAAPAASVLATRRLLHDAATRTPDEQRAAERAAQIPLLQALVPTEPAPATDPGR